MHIQTVTHPIYHSLRGTTPPHTHVLTKTSRKVGKSAHPSRPDPAAGGPLIRVGVLARKHNHLPHGNTHDEAATTCSALATDTPYTTRTTHEQSVDTDMHTPTHPTHRHPQGTTAIHTHVPTKILRTAHQGPNTSGRRLRSRVGVSTQELSDLGSTGTAVRSMRGKACPPTMSKTSVGKTPAKPRADHHHRPIHSANAHKKTHPAFPIHTSPPRITRPKSKKGLEIPGANFPT